MRAYLQSVIDLEQQTESFYKGKVSLNHLTMAQEIISLKELLSDPDFLIRVTAAGELFQLGEKCTEAERVYEEALTEPDYMRRLLAVSLASLHDQIPESIVKLYCNIFSSSTDWYFRVMAAAALLGHRNTLEKFSKVKNDKSQIIPSFHETLTTLGVALKGISLNINDIFINELMMSSFVSTLMNEAGLTLNNPMHKRMLIDSYKTSLAETLQFFAAYAMVKHGVRSSDAMKVLLLFVNSNKNLYDIFLISNLGPAAAEALPVLHAMMKQPDASPSLRQVVSEAIGKIGTGPSVSKELVKPLLRALKAEEWMTACNIVDSLLELGEPPVAAAQAMIRVLDNQDIKVRSLAAITLGRFTNHLDLIVPSLIKHSETGEYNEFWQSLLEGISAISQPAVPYLIQAVSGGNRRYLSFVGEALIKIGGNAAGYVAQELLTHPDFPVKSFAAGCLRMMGPRARSAVPVVIQLLKEGDETTRMAAILALSGIGHDAVEAAPQLIRALSEPEYEMRLWAENALVAIGPGALPALEAAFQTADSPAKEAIKRIAGKLGAMVVQKATGPDYEWIGDDRRIECFVNVCQIFEQTSIRSVRGAAEELSRLQSLGLISCDIITGYSAINYRIGKLEESLSDREGRTISLMDTHATRPNGLTADGRHYLGEFRRYLTWKKAQKIN